MKNKLLKRFVLMLALVFIFSIFSFGASSSFFIDEAPLRGALISVNAEEAESAAAGGGASNQESAEGTTDEVGGASNKDNSTDGKTRSGKGTLMIVISCIVSLALAIFLAVRKANKVYGKGWD